MRRQSILVAMLGVLLLAAAPAFAAKSITLETAEGVLAGDTINSGTTVRWVFRIQNDSFNFGVSNGFRVYSEDGAVWDSIVGDTVGWRVGDPTPGVAILGKALFDLQYAVNRFSNDGLLADTVGFIAAKISTTGLIPTFDDTAWAVAAFDVSGANGTHICIDSSWFRPGGTWKWAASGGVNRFPAWSGPKCYYIKGPDDVKEVDGELPNSFALDQNYPNPFNPTTVIKFDIPRNSKVNLTIYNVLGQAVKTLVDKDLTAGKYQADWDATSDSGNKVASGVYFYKIEAGDFVQTKKMMLLR